MRLERPPDAQLQDLANHETQRLDETKEKKKLQHPRAPGAQFFLTSHFFLGGQAHKRTANGAGRAVSALAVPQRCTHVACSVRPLSEQERIAGTRGPFDKPSTPSCMRMDLAIRI